MSDLDSINLVLDTTAILGFVRGIDAVGEVVREVADAGLLVALPVTCMAQAHQSAVDEDLLQVLASNPATLVIGDEPDEWLTLAHLLGLVDDLPAASAALLAVDAGCLVLTARPERYSSIGSGELALPFHG
ncbi:hypothetical protein [Actinoplanes sp. NPDC051494]|uniref:hypothetical protein n=1 Tax=Actinoplanes sp. NPDC051494 TaxID=3363907 RepID=UPI0037BB9D48